MRALVTPDLEAVASASDVFPRLLAQGFALAGQTGPALHWLKRAIARGFINFAPRDATVLAAVSLVLTLTAVAAASIPASRAARVNPIVALRVE